MGNSSVASPSFSPVARRGVGAAVPQVRSTSPPAAVLQNGLVSVGGGGPCAMGTVSTRGAELRMEEERGGCLPLP